MFEVRWEFDVRPERRDEFLAIYGAAGDWVQLFQSGAGYLGTELEQTGPSQWITIDRWESRTSYEEFRAAHADDYARLDTHCAALTIAERLLSKTGD